MIQHLAISINQITNSDKFVSKVKEIVENCIEKQIPVLTLRFPKTEFDMLDEIIEKISSWEKINSEKIKVSVFGKWYDLATRIIEKIKKIINETKHYDTFFLNFCIGYNGQEEIVDACKLLAIQAKAEKISPEQINKMSIKENLYTSAFMPPEKIIITGGKNKLEGFLLWDSKKAEIVFAEEEFEELIL